LKWEEGEKLYTELHITVFEGREGREIYPV
jgi:hypothetical protein